MPNTSASIFVFFFNSFLIVNNERETVDNIGRDLTNDSRQTRNAKHFYYACSLVIKSLCGRLVVALFAA